MDSSTPVVDRKDPAQLAATAPLLPVLQSSDLLGARRVIDIEHNGQRYRLQTTKAGKLILTK